MKRVSARMAVVGAGACLGLAAIGFAATRTPGTTPVAALGPPLFVEEADAAGLAHTYGGKSTFAVGGGVAVFDCNGDGKPDLYLSGGSNRAGLYRNESPIGGALRFALVTAPATDLTGVTGAYPLDIDSDDNVDLAVLRVGESVLLRGLGACRFERANEKWDFSSGRAMTTAFSATWERSDGMPTLAIGNYLSLDANRESTLPCATSGLFRPNPAGTSFAAPIELAPGYCTLSMLFSDWDRSGRRDLRVSNDREYYELVDGQEQLWRMSPGQPPRLYAAADGWVPVQIEGMGIASYDVTGDGYPEVFLTSQAANRLQTLTAGPGEPMYRDIAARRGVEAASPFAGVDSLPSTAWHPEFADVNNDGFADLFISKGNVDAQPGFAQKDPSNLLLGQPDGMFVERADVAGILSFAPGRGAALADFNLDGLLDLIEVNYREPVKLWRNVGAGDASRPAAMGNWLAIRVSQPGSNRDAIGAWLEVRIGDVTVRRELTVGGGHISGQLGWVHFGVGPSADAQVRVQWPDGETGPWVRVPANGFAFIDRGSASARPWSPGT